MPSAIMPTARKSIACSGFSDALALMFAWRPQDIILAVVVKDPRKHEEQIGKPIQVNHHLRVDGFRARQTHNAAFGPATRGARQVAPGRCGRAAWQNKGAQRL